MKIKTFLLTALVAVTLLSCSKKTDSFMYSDMASDAAPMLASRASNGTNAKMTSNSVDYAAEEGSVYPEYGSDSLVNQSEKKLIKSGNVSLEVSVLSDAVKQVEDWAGSLEGYIANSQISEDNAWFSVKVPAKNFDSAMNSAGSIGKVLNHSVNTDDVSEQYYDLESRIENKKVMKNKLENYLKEAKDISDLLKIEKELNSVISDLDSMESRLKRLSNQVEYSTISVNLSLPVNHNESGFIFPNLKNSFSNLISYFLNFLVGFVKVFILVILCGIPVLAAVAFFYWLLIGRVGLLIKLHNWLKGRK